jgi:hypothetical protein
LNGKTFNRDEFCADESLEAEHFCPEEFLLADKP